MEILLLIGLLAGGWLLWKSARGEDPMSTTAGKAVGGCLGVGCLGMLLLSIAAVVLLWLLLQAIADIDLSLSGLGEGSGSGDDRPRRD